MRSLHFSEMRDCISRIHLSKFVKGVWQVSACVSVLGWSEPGETTLQYLQGGSCSLY